MHKTTEAQRLALLFDAAEVETEGGALAAEHRDALASFARSATCRRARAFLTAVRPQVERLLGRGRATPAARPRAPHAPTRARHRGARRESRSSGDDDPDPEPRRCLGCDRPLTHRAPQARFHDEACRAKHRRRERAEAESAAPLIGKAEAEQLIAFDALAAWMALPPKVGADYRAVFA